MESLAVRSGPILRAEHLTKQFGNDSTAVTAVNDVSISLSAGEIVLIMGPSGSGKTTLLSMLGCLLRPSAGTILLQDLQVSALPEAKLPEVRLNKIGFIFQDFNLLSTLSAQDNVALVARLAGQPKANARKHAASLLGEFGMDRRLGFRPAQLSGGEKQRVAIARALVNDPALILADEPTANLDSKIGRDVMSLFRGFTYGRERGVIIVSHDSRISDIADRVLWLEDGRIAEMGALPIDPVCGMAVERSDAPTTMKNGVVITFCSAGCREEFLADPGRFGPVTGMARGELDSLQPPMSERSTLQYRD